MGMLSGFGDFFNKSVFILLLVILANIFGMYTDLYWLKHLITFADFLILIPIVFILL